MSYKKRYLKSDNRNIQPNKSKTQNFQEGSLERKLGRQNREQEKFDKSTDALINWLRKTNQLREK